MLNILMLLANTEIRRGDRGPLVRRLSNALDRLTDRLDNLLQNGEITQEERDSRRQQLIDMITDTVDIYDFDDFKREAKAIKANIDKLK